MFPAAGFRMPMEGIFTARGEVRLRDCAHSRIVTLERNGFDVRTRDSHPDDFPQMFARAKLCVISYEKDDDNAIERLRRDGAAVDRRTAAVHGRDRLRWPCCGEMRGEFWMSTQRIRQAIFIAYLGIFASLIGVLPWIYLLVASFSEEVREILPFHPLWDSLVYYLFSVALNESKARVARW